MMMNLEKVEIGGTRGHTLSAQVVVLYEEFQELHKKMSEARPGRDSQAQELFVGTPRNP